MSELLDRDDLGQDSTSGEDPEDRELPLNQAKGLELANRQNSGREVAFEPMANYVQEVSGKPPTSQAPPLKKAKSPPGGGKSAQPKAVKPKKKKAKQAPSASSKTVPPKVTKSAKEKGKEAPPLVKADVSRAETLKKEFPGVKGIPSAIPKESYRSMKEKFSLLAKGKPKTILKQKLKALVSKKKPNDVAQQPQLPLPQFPTAASLPTVPTDQQRLDLSREYCPYPSILFTKSIPLKGQSVPQKAPQKPVLSNKMAPPSEDRRAEVAFNLRPGASHNDPIVFD